VNSTEETNTPQEEALSPLQLAAKIFTKVLLSELEGEDEEFIYVLSDKLERAFIEGARWKDTTLSMEEFRSRLSDKGIVILGCNPRSGRTLHAAIEALGIGGTAGFIGGVPMNMTARDEMEDVLSTLDRHPSKETMASRAEFLIQDLHSCMEVIPEFKERAFVPRKELPKFNNSKNKKRNRK